MSSRKDGSSTDPRASDERIVGPFIVKQQIGKGSFAEVYIGWHRETRAAVAVKSVLISKLNNKLKENLYGEIQILKTLRHPHIVALHDCIESDTHINLVMEYCELGDLSCFIRKRHQLSTHPATRDLARKYPSVVDSGLHEVVIRHFLKQLTSALQFLRSKNYVHRDVKPQNLLLLPSRGFRRKETLAIMTASHDSLIPVAGLASLPMLKLADFGFARVLPSTSMADTLCGSPLYMAPEILHYERYDAKADLWSVGTVLYEMVTGKPPFRAANHVKLIQKIDAAEDVIRFPKEAVSSPDMKGLIRSLLKRRPVERLSFENLFSHPIITSQIPHLVEDDVPRPIQKDLRAIPQGGEHASPPQSSLPRQALPDSSRREVTALRPPREPLLSRPLTGSSPRDAAAGLGIQRPVPQHALSTPNHPKVSERPSREQKGLRGHSTKESPSQGTRQAAVGKPLTDEEKAAQDVMFERDYVVVERRHVEVNAFADELAANERLTGHTSGPRSTAMVRRSTQQGAPNSVTGAVPVPASRTALIAQGRAVHDRRSSYERPLSASPSSASSAISKAIQDASLRLFGYKVAPVRGKGHSPPMYQPFPAYPTPPSSGGGLLGDGKGSPSTDEDIQTKAMMAEYAERSDCVYGFAEVKYKQLIPLTPCLDHGLGGIGIDQVNQDEEGLTVEAIVALSEESLVLYVKSLTLLARAMDLASLWWAKKSRGESGNGISAAISENVAQSINAIVQWVRQRFNEVLEKSEVVRMKLVEAQKMLPEDHTSHPLNQGPDSDASSAESATKQVYLTPGISAEKLMYDRALEMSRAAAIDEVTNQDLPGCKLSYVTAIRMLEAVLDTDDGAAKRSLSSKEPARSVLKEMSSGLEGDEEHHVRKMIQMIKGRLAAVAKKQQAIADANSKEQQAQLQALNRRSGDVTPRSVPSNSSA